MDSKARPLSTKPVVVGRSGHIALRMREAPRRTQLLGWAVIVLGLLLVSASARMPATLPECRPPNAPTTVEIGQPTYVCLTFNGVSRALFNPVADQYTAIGLNGSALTLLWVCVCLLCCIERGVQGNPMTTTTTATKLTFMVLMLVVLAASIAMPAGTPLLEMGTGNSVVPVNVSEGVYYIVFDVASYTQRSIPKLYQQITVNEQGLITQKRFIPVYTAIISVEQGTVIGVTFDEGCFFCPEADTTVSCIGNTYINATGSIADSPVYRSCASTCTGAGCDLKLYLTWTGTDIRGNFFTTANLRFSRFRQFGIGGLYLNITQSVTEGFNDAVRTAEEVVEGKI